MKKKLILVFCVLVALAWYMAVNEAVENPKRLAEHLEQAAAYEAKGIYVDAITEYESALKYAPEDVEITYKMAKAYLQVGNTKQYEKICKGLIESNPQKGQILDDFVNYYLGKRDKSQAVKYVAKLVEEHPENECAQKWLIELKGSYQEIYFGYSELCAAYGDTLVVSAEDSESGEVRYGVLDALGNEILPVEYEAAQPFSDAGFAMVVKDGSTIYVDEEGNTRKVPDMSLYDTVGMMNNERIVVSRDGRYGLLDDTMNPKVEPIYEEITLPSDNLAAARQNGKWALISRNGKEKTEYIYDDVIRDEYGIATRQKRLFVQEAGAYHIIDSKGEAIGGLTFEAAKAFPKDGYAAVCNGGKWGYVNADGELKIEYQFEEAKSFSNGYAAVCQDGKWGYIDITGTVVIQPEFEHVTDITAKGTALVNNGKWVMIQLSLFR